MKRNLNNVRMYVSINILNHPPETLIKIFTAINKIRISKL